MKHLLTLIMCVVCQATYVAGQTDIEVINIENDALHAYLADSTYWRPGGMKKTVVEKYTGTGKYRRSLEIPRGKEVKWQTATPVVDIDEFRITVSENADFSDSYTYTAKSNKSTSYTIYNSIPQHTYYYKAEEILKDGTTNELTSGVFRAEGRIRMICVDGVNNVRDIGGWPSTLGGTLCYGRLYRSANLDRVTARGRHDFAGVLNVGAELDLRGESKRTSSPLGEEIDYTRIVAGSYLYALSKKPEKMVEDLEWIVARLRENKNVDWHCAIGCDRCGTVSLLVEGVLGVSEIDLGRDYEISRFTGNQRYRNQAGICQAIDYIKKQGPEDDLAQCFYNYLVNNGMPVEDIEFLRDVMIER